MKLRLLLILALAMLIAGACPTVAKDRPDIIFLLVDDLGSYDVGWRGSEIKTPHLDKLAMAGARLENFYVQPVCSPTRAALMTGRYPIRYGLQTGVIRPWSKYGLPLEERTLPQALKEVGYTTAICGKWHLGSFERTYWPNQRGFDHWYGHLFGAIDHFTHERYKTFDWWRNGTVNRDEGYSTHLIARDAVAVINGQAKDKPLFLYVPFNAVHDPYQVPEEYKKPYEHFPEPRRTYAGMLAAVDEAVGQIVAATEKAGRRQNTLFIFCSDNGGPAPGRITSNGPLRSGKGSVYEGGTRTCAFATWDKRIPAGSVDALAHISDWYPTLLKLTGASLKQPLPLDGKDIWPCLTQGKPSPRKELLINATASTGALRIGDWKVVIRSGNSPEKGTGKQKKKNEEEGPGIELFNLADDPSESKNLAEAHPGKLKELRTRYEQLAAEAVTPKNLGEVQTEIPTLQ